MADYQTEGQLLTLERVGASGFSQRISLKRAKSVSADLRYAVCARERLANVPDGVLAVTAADIFA